MTTQRYPFMHSVMNYIHLSLVTILAIAMLSIFFSFWLTEKTDNDARAINLSGSMRMQTYHIALTMLNEPQQARHLISKLDRTWTSPIFANLNQAQTDHDLKTQFTRGYQNWFGQLRPYLLEKLSDLDVSELDLSLIEQQVAYTDSLVNQLQLDAEGKIRSLRTIQLLSLLVTVMVGSLIFYLLKNRVEEPLGQLTQAAKKIAGGELEQHIPVSGDDELGLLAKGFNQMSTSITETHKMLESRVAERTEELQLNNTLLSFLFENARAVLDSDSRHFDYQRVIKTLSELLQQPSLELCLFTARGELPYMQVEASETALHCKKTTCADCKSNAPFDSVEALGMVHRFPVNRGETQYGVLQLRSEKLSPLPAWKDQLLRSVADQFAIALSLNETREQEHRLAMLNERTVIARELHDSLAQALSYLQIQVMRLQKSHDKQKYEHHQAIIDELREGLSSAYRHLRELLTTFRLKIDTEGLEGALKQTIEQCRKRGQMRIEFSYGLQNLPLNSVEEIHLLQIIREACQNALNHSEGTVLRIRLAQTKDKAVSLQIDDDGKGLPENPEKLNHYGLAIMMERGKHLGGELEIGNRPQGGTCISLLFSPAYLNQAA